VKPSRSVWIRGWICTPMVPTGSSRFVSTLVSVKGKRGIVAGVTSMSRCSPSRSTVSTTGVEPAARSARDRSRLSLSATPSTAVTTSPARTPASTAGAGTLPGSVHGSVSAAMSVTPIRSGAMHCETAPTAGACSRTAPMARVPPTMSSTVRMKCTVEPAARTTTFCRTGAL